MNYLPGFDIPPQQQQQQPPPQPNLLQQLQLALQQARQSVAAAPAAPPPPPQPMLPAPTAAAEPSPSTQDALNSEFENREFFFWDSLPSFRNFYSTRRINGLLLKTLPPSLLSLQ